MGWTTAASENGQNPNKPNGAQQQFLSPEEVLTLPINELFVRLDTSASGLSHEEADIRLVRFGPNELARKKNVPPFSIFFHVSEALL